MRWFPNTGKPNKFGAHYLIIKYFGLPRNNNNLLPIFLIPKIIFFVRKSLFFISCLDIAVGSPYENNGEGAVYIYHGSEDGIKQPETQKITPSDLGSGDLPVDRLFNYTFGYSLAGGIDLDGNDYPELIVGAFEMDSIVAIRWAALSYLLLL